MRRALSILMIAGVLATVGVVGVGVYASGENAEVFGLSRPSPSPEPAPTTTSTTTTTKPKPSPSPTPLTDEIAPDVKAALLADAEVLKPGSTGPAVLALETRLQQLRYDIDKPDSDYDDVTSDAVMAFQKVNDLDRDGVAGPLTRKAMTDPATKIQPLAPADAPKSRLEIDMTQQIMRLYNDGTLTRVISTSTGSGQWFVVEEELRVSIAVTNAGVFEIGRKYPDWEKGPLGSLYKPMYFDGGIAIHGYTSVPPYPASHGCARVPMHTQEWLYDAVPTGFPVYVFGSSPAAETDRPPTPTRPPETDTIPSSTTETVPPETAPGTTTTTTTTTEPPAPGDTETPTG